MRLRNIRGSREAIAESPYVIKEPWEYKGKWQELFAKPQPLHIEIGMGKGKFIMEQSRQNPDINYIGIEKYSSVLIRALEHMEEETGNLTFIRMDAEDIEDIFSEDEVDRIYLNFSDPWPKDRHAKRRLTSGRFLQKYTHFLKREGSVIFKTDNRALFDFSLNEAEEAGWELVSHTYDLHNSPYMEGNIMTEYEERFSAKGSPICRMEIRRQS